MTPAEEVLEALRGRLATCICGQPVGCKRDTGIVTCVCRRRWVKQMPTDGSWCTYQQIDIRGRGRNFHISTKSSREYVEG